MARGLAAKFVSVTLGSALFIGSAAYAQEHVALMPQLGMEGVTSVAFSPDGHFVLTGGTDARARLWDAATGMHVRSFVGHGDVIYHVAFSPDGRFVLTGSRDKTARLWNAANGQEVLSFEGHSDVIFCVAFSPDGRFVLTGSMDKTARLWDTATGKWIRTFEGHKQAVVSVVFSPDGRFVLTGSDDKTARLWDATTGQQIRTFEGHTGFVNSVAFSPDGHFVLTGSDDKTARLWNAATGQVIRSFDGQAGQVNSVAFSPDGRSVLTGNQDHTARLWDAAGGQQVRTFEGLNKTIYSAAFSFDGRYVVAGGDDRTAQLWDAATGRQIHSLSGHTSRVNTVAFSPDGSYMVTGSEDRTAHLWEVATGQQIHSFTGHAGEVKSVALSADDRYLLTGGSDDSVELWEAASGKEIRAFTAFVSGMDFPVAFSPDGRSVLTWGRSNGARMLDAATGQQICSLEGHTSVINSAAFSRDGHFVITGSNDTTVRLWDAFTGKQLAMLLSFDKGGWAVTDPEGRYDSNDPDNTPGLAWVTDSNRVIELKQLKDSYYTPNLLASIMKGERLPDVKGLNLVPAPPEVAVESPYQPMSKHISLVIEDKGGGVGRLVVSVNDRKVAVLEHPVARRSTTKDNCGNKAEVNVDLSAATLKPGENTIIAYSFDARNQIRSHEAVTTFTVSAKAKGFTVAVENFMAADYRPQFYGVIVGTARFAGDHAIDLQYPAHDAESMMTGLEIGAGKLFGAENVHLRLLTTDAKDESGQPTKRNIAAAFANVMQKAKPTDVLLVYLSGHGVNLRTEKDSYYYLTTDARSLEIENNPTLRGLSTVSATELRSWLGAKDMPLKEVLILDTCAAGAANGEMLKLVEKREVPPDQRRAVEFLKDAVGTIILMGSAADKVSYEASKYGQGLLTYALLEGMRGRSVESGSRLNVSHWFQNASEDVTQLAQSIGGVQKPVIAAPNGTGFPVALLDPTDQARIPMAAIKPEMIHLRCHDEDDNDPLGLEVAIREQLRNISHPSVSGQRDEPPIVYYDDMNDGPVSSLAPKVVYSVSGSTVSLRLRIDQAGKTLKEDRLNLSSTDKRALANAVAAELVTLAEQIPIARPNP